MTILKAVSYQHFTEGESLVFDIIPYLFLFSCSSGVSSDFSSIYIYDTRQYLNCSLLLTRGIREIKTVFVEAQTSYFNSHSANFFQGIFINELEGGDRTKAMKRLRVLPLEEKVFMTL